MSAWIEEVLDRAERALERAGVRTWEIAADVLEHAAVEAMDGKVHAVERSFERTLGVRVLERGIGFAGLTDPDDQAIAETIEAALAEARRARPAAITAFASGSQRSAEGNSADTEFFDERATGELRAILEPNVLELEALALAADKKIKRVRPARIEEQRSMTAIRTHAGCEIRERSSRAFAMVGAIAEDDDGEEAQSSYGSDSAPAIEALDLGRIAREAAGEAARLLGPGLFGTARVPVIFGYDATAELIALLVAALEADRLERGASFLKDKLHAQAVSAALTIVDDPHDPDLDASARFDGEGLGTRLLPLIRRGVIENLLDDRDTAARAGRLATAHGVRGSANVRPQPGVHNMVVEAGSVALSALLRHAEGGLYVHELSGTHTMNDVTGELSLGATGWAVRGGALEDSIEGATVAGTLIEMLSGPIHLSADTRRIGAFRVPAMLIEEVSVSSAESGDEA